MASPWFPRGLLLAAGWTLVRGVKGPPLWDRGGCSLDRWGVLETPLDPGPGGLMVPFQRSRSGAGNFAGGAGGMGRGMSPRPVSPARRMAIEAAIPQYEYRGPQV